MHLLLPLLFASQTPSAAQPESAHVVIVATTDVHGRALAWDYVRDREAPGGLSRAAAILTTLRAQYPDQVVLVDAGDLLEGNPFAAYFGRIERRRPNPLVDALNALRYDAATPGNHDFDFGVDRLWEAGTDATYRYVSANLVAGARDSLLFPATLVVLRGGVRVGITGFTTPGVMVWDRRQLAGRVRVRPIAAAAPAAIAALDRAGVDLKVVLVHSGLDETSSYDTSGVGPENAARSFADLSRRPDLVVVGHTHREIRDSVINGVHFVQPKPWALSLSVVHVWFVRGDSGSRASGTGRWRISGIRADLIPLATVAEAPALPTRLTDAHQRVRAWADEAIGTAGPGFEGRYARAEDTPLLDFINEVQRRRAGAQLAATADFDVSAGLPDGTVRRRDVAGIYPYENTLVAVRISGRQLKDYLEQATRYYRGFTPGGRLVDDAVPGYDFDAISGAAYRIDLTRAVGQRIVALGVNGHAVLPTDSFTLATNSYRAAGGGGYDMLRGSPIVYDRGESVADLLMDEIRTAGTVQASAYFTPSWGILPPADSAVHALFAPPPPPLPQTDSTLLRVLAITDFHGALAPRIWPWSLGRLVGGSAAIKVWLDSLDHECGCTVVRLDGGDEMQGTPASNFAYGRPVIAAFNALGIDVAAVGDHEFDWTVDTLRARLREARYQFVSANLTDSAGRVPEWAEPWTVITRGGAKVAVIGLTTTTTPSNTRPRNVAELRFGDFTSAVQHVLPAVRAAADFVIVVAHAGDAEVFDLARGLDSGVVDLIVAGHTHQLLDTLVHGIPIVQAGSAGQAIAVVDIIRRAGGLGRQIRARLETPWADSVIPDRALAADVARVQRAADSVTAQPVTTLRLNLRRDGDEHPLGRLIADAFRNMGRADLAVINSDGIKSDLQAGVVTYGALYEALPFRNRVMRLTITGAVLREVLEHAVAGGSPDIHVAGLQVWYDPGRPVGQKVQRVRLTAGANLDPNRIYTLAVSDFLADGGAGYAMLTGLPRIDTGLVDLDAVIAYVSVLRKPVDAPADQRFHRGTR